MMQASRVRNSSGENIPLLGIDETDTRPLRGIYTAPSRMKRIGRFLNTHKHKIIIGSGIGGGIIAGLAGGLLGEEKKS